MRQTLQLRLGQQLTMTPQLQQAIRLLQLSSVDLQTEIQSFLDSNVMLERTDEAQATASRGDEADGEPVDSAGFEAAAPPAETRDDADRAGEGAAAEELPVAGAWDDVYDGYEGTSGHARGDDEDQRDALAQYAAAGPSLREHLLWQMQLSPFSERDRIIATAIIDAIDDTGYLSLPLEDVHRGLAGELEIEPAEVETVLHRIQSFDPPGVAARSPQECLLLQLRQCPTGTAWLEQARLVVEQYLDLLAGHDFGQLLRRLRVSDEELQAIVGLIRSLNPHPGSQLSAERPQYVVPDVFVYRREGIWRVELNPESAPRLRINGHYARLARQIQNSADGACLRNHLQEARWFLKSLRNRSETLLKVATGIVERQRTFFELGEEHMQPLVLRDIAEALNMHESTISRVTTQKYMHTPRGIFEFKYFFSSHVGTSDGGAASATAIRAMIRKLISEENPRKPLSDSKITQCLGKDGIQVARRTVAKYREAMSIPSSSDRKRLV